jgi:hypothetical protein
MFNFWATVGIQGPAESFQSATDTTKVSIFGLPGEKILETTMETGTSRVFSLAGRASGVYYVRVETGSETIKGKIVKL